MKKIILVCCLMFLPLSLTHCIENVVDKDYVVYVYMEKEKVYIDTYDVYFSSDTVYRKLRTHKQFAKKDCVIGQFTNIK